MNNFIVSKKTNKNINMLFYNKNNYFSKKITKNSPSLYREWYNFNYNYNNTNRTNNFLYYNLIIKLIENYFNLKNYNNNVFFNKLFISKPYIKFNNNKLFITLFIFNREKFSRFKILFLHINKINLIFKYLFINNNYIYLFINEINKYRFILLNLLVNKLKFHKHILTILIKYIKNMFGKKIELNIINLKNFKFNSDILTKILSIKIKNRNTNIMNLYKTILTNTFKNNIKKNKNNFKLFNFLFDIIPYKNIKGISLLSKGRLTKRYKADRSIKLYNLIGGLNNFNYNNKYKALYRNNIYSNIEYSKYIDKRRIGSFAIKGWISGKY